MKKLNVCIVGSGGRVGKELLDVIHKSSEWLPTVGIGRNSNGFLLNTNNFKNVTEYIDVMVDFSSPDLMMEAIDHCVLNKIPFVSGTTGLNEVHFNKLKEASAVIPVLWSPNMSLGVALVKKCYAALNSLSGPSGDNFDFAMEEWHHKNKKDSPSGTAKMLIDHFENSVGRKISSTNCFRAGGIFGVHKLHLVSDEEHIAIEHTALNRAVFAKGALIAAKWLLQKKNGIYNIDDVLSIET